jgi:two-component system, NarL family, nitrate/nitrite response regulator NarL
MTVSGEAVRVLLADDHPIFRLGLRKLLDSEPGFRVVGEAAEAEQAIELARTLSPHVVLLDLRMPGGGGLRALSELAGLDSAPLVVILTVGISREETTRALRLGARGIFLKDTATDLLFRCIRAVLAGEYWVGRGAVGDLIGALRAEAEPGRQSWGRAALTRRELDVVVAVVAGAPNKDIAQQYGISEQTVKHHLTSIFDKLGVSSRLELAMYAVHHRLVAFDREDA